MTKEELREHCEKQVKMCEEWAKGNNREPSGKIYEEHKLILDLIKALEQAAYYKNLAQSYEKTINKLTKAIAEQQPSDDCVSRQAVLNAITEIDGNINMDIYTNEVREIIKDLPPVTPTQCIATVQFNKEELREICNERIEIECTHGTCKDCAIKQLDKSESAEVGTEKYYCPIVSRYVDETPSFYCADFEKRGNEND